MSFEYINNSKYVKYKVLFLSVTFNVGVINLKNKYKK